MEILPVENKDYSAFCKNVKSKLLQNMNNHPKIKEYTTELNKIEKMKKLFKEVTA